MSEGINSIDCGVLLLHVFTLLIKVIVSIILSSSRYGWISPIYMAGGFSIDMAALCVAFLT